MFVIVGLGNPGKKFDHTRHNAGFEVLDYFAAQNNFPEFELSKKYASLISESGEVLLAKPQTLMNDSGRAVKKLIRPYPLDPSPLIVVHDDIDMELGKIKLVKDSGSGGHKGVESIIQALGNNNFMQLKLGVATGPEKAEEVVLKKFSSQEYETVRQSIQNCAEMLKKIIDEQR